LLSRLLLQSMVLLLRASFPCKLPRRSDARRRIAFELGGNLDRSAVTLVWEQVSPRYRFTETHAFDV
jgi:hypothetical protein